MSTASSRSREQQHQRVLEQQRRYAMHLNKQLQGLQTHSGAFGQLALAVENSTERANDIGAALDSAQLALSVRSRAPISDKENAAAAANAAASAAVFAGGEGSPSPSSCGAVAPLPPLPDLDGMATQLETLARNIHEHEQQADARSAALRQDIARVMEVYEDPSVFLPPPLPNGPNFGGHLSASSRGRGKEGSSRSNKQSRSQAPSELLQSHYGPLALHTGAGLSMEPPQPQYNHTSAVTGFDYGRMSGFIRSVVRERVSEELDGGDAPRAMAPVWSDSRAAADPLAALRHDVARKFHELDRDPSLAESKEAVRKQVHEAAARPAGTASAAAAAFAARMSDGGKGSRGRAAAAQEPPAAAAARPKPRGRSDQNPDLYPAFAELSQIFPNGGNGAPATVARQLFGGLAQAIPNYVQYQEYLAAQAAQQQMQRQAAEQQRAMEEQREAEEMARMEAKARRAAAELAAKSAAAAAAAASAAASAAAVVPPLSLPAQASSAHPTAGVSIQTSARYPPHGDARSQRADAATDTRPPLQHGTGADFFPNAAMHGLPQPLSTAYFGGHQLPRFDAIWEVLPASKDAAVQSDPHAAALQQQQQHQQQQQQQYSQQFEQAPNHRVDASTHPMSPRSTTRSLAPSVPSSPSAAQRHVHPRATAMVGGHNPQQMAAMQQQQESLQRMGGGAAAAGAGAGAPGPKQHPLSVLEQAALEVQRQGSRVRGEGLSSSRALDSLMQAARPGHSAGVELVTQEPAAPTDLTVPPHPLFSSAPSARLSAYPDAGLLGLVLQMYDMPSELEVSAEWKRVVDEEEAREARRAEEQQEAAAAGGAENQERAELRAQTVAAAEAEEAARQQQAAAEEAAEAQRASDRATELAAAEAAAAQQEQQAAAEAAVASSAAAEKAEELQRQLAAEAAERARLAGEAARMAKELEELREQQAQAQAKAAAAAVAASSSADPSAAAEKEAEQKRQWEAELRTRWAAEQEEKRLAELQAATDAARHAQQLAEIESARRALAVEAELARAAAVERNKAAAAVDAAAIAPALAAEVERIRAAQVAEKQLMEKVREEERRRWEEEEARRAADRQRIAEQHAAEEAQYAARRAEREKEEERRRELERRRDELLETKLAVESEKTQAELAALRADVERIRQRANEPSPTAAAAAAAASAAAAQSAAADFSSTPSFRRPAGSDVDSSSDLSMFEIDPRRPPQQQLQQRFPRVDLSEGEIDLGPHARLYSPGMVAVPQIQQQLEADAALARSAIGGGGGGSRRAMDRHSAAVLHPPIPSITPARPGAAGPREQKYASDGRARIHFHSSTREDIADLLDASRHGEGGWSSSGAEGGAYDAYAHVPLSSQFNLRYTSSITQARAALAVPSRQVILGPSSPPLSDISSVASPAQGRSYSGGSSDASTPSPLARHTVSLLRGDAGAHSSSKKALRLLKKKYSALKARQHALEDETSSAFEDSLETLPVEEQLARAKRKARFTRSPTKKVGGHAGSTTAAAAAAAAATGKPRRSTAHGGGTSGDGDGPEEGEWMPSAEVRHHARQAATRAAISADTASLRETPPATADSASTRPHNITVQPPVEPRSIGRPESALSPLMQRAVSPRPNATPNWQPRSLQPSAPAAAPAQAERPPTPQHPAAADEWSIPPESAYGTRSSVVSPALGESARTPAHGQAFGQQQQLQQAAGAFLTSGTPPSSSPPSPAVVVAARPASASSRPGSSTSASGRFVEPPSPTGKHSKGALLSTLRSTKPSQAAMLAQHRARLQAAKQASQQKQQQQQSRPNTGASGSDPFAAYDSRPASSASQSLGGGIGGLSLGMERPVANSYDTDLHDASEHSFNSPSSVKPTSTEQWIKSLHD